MAGVLVNVSSGEVSLVGSTAKTVLQLKTPAQQRGIIRAIRFAGKAAAGGTDTPIKIRLTRSTANYGTATSNTVVSCKNNTGDPETVQSAFMANFSTEPTSPTDGAIYWELQPQTVIEEFYPNDKGIIIPGNASAQLEFTASTTETVVASVLYEE